MRARRRATWAAVGLGPGRCAAAVAAVVAAVVAASAWSPPIGAAPTTPSGAVTASTPYYLALGDSLAAGTGASTTATRYVDVLATHEAARFPGLQLVDLACGGATTTSVINGPGCSYTTGTQLGDAEAFLRAHPGHVPFVTIDIGANDVDGCLSGSTVNPGCVQSGLAHICTDLPQILAGLDAAYPGLVVYGMDYYDPFLGLWITGPTGQTLAQQSEALALSLNGQLAQIYAAGGVATADPATLFQTSDFAPTGSYLGVTEPQNVADVCNWTLFCSGGGNIHANDIGHGLVAQAFEQVVDNLSVVTAALPEAVRGTTYGPVPLAAAGLGVSDGPFLTTLTWTKVALPRGLHLSRAGILSGVPGRHLAAGPTSVTVRVTETVTTVSGRVTTRTKTTVQSAIPLTLT